ncbi:MAG TPA: PQQ-binding-like beta-propeller repeat protein [Solirubrobacteraceae bacterium]|nr:PQQ-binding-like beta-propeller repeat protein [Solirubrobacteraceae bacterium]
MSPDRPRSRRRIFIGGLALLLLTVGGAAAAYVLVSDRDVSNPDVEFRPEPTQTPVPDPAVEPKKGEKDPLDDFVWAQYGYSKDRRRYLPASRSLRPPFWRKWSVTGKILLEFAPVIGGRSLYLLKNNGAVYAIAKKTGRVRWKRKMGYLAAASPAYAHGRVFVTVLKRSRRTNAGRVAALSAEDGRVLWSKPLPSRSESSPLIDNGRLYFGTENGTVYALRARNGEVRWTYRAAGAVKGGLALANGKLYFGDYGGRVQAVRQRDGVRVWSTSTRGSRFGTAAGNFYSTPAVAFSRVYIGNTDGNVYSFASSNGKLAWRKGTGGYVYASPAVAQAPGGKPSVYIGSYDGNFYSLDARSGRVLWRHRAGGKISGGATVIGDIVYFSNLSAKSTTGLGARTGRKVFSFGRGAFNPAVSDGRMLFVTGYSSLYGLKVKRAR